MNKINIIKKVHMYCSVCGEEHELDLCEELTDGIIKNEKVNYIEHYYRCNKYNVENTFMIGEQWNESLINLMDAYRVSHDLLTSKDIKNIRNKYNITQAELAFLLGMGEVTITRYETKQIQDVSNDNILKMINNNAIWALELLEKNKEKFSEKRYKEISENIKMVIDIETKSYLTELQIIGKYINYDEEDSLNGNCLLNLDKIKNILAYITKSMGEVKKVVLMKILWYIDALSFKQNNRAMTGLVYTHMPYGALPIAYEYLLELQSIKYEVKVCDDERYEYRIFENPNFKIVGLSKSEKNIIDTVINKFRNYRSSEIAEYMHKEKAYIETEPEEIISFYLTKDLNEF